MAISLHINVDNCPRYKLDRALLYLIRTKQREVNIAGGAQMDLTMQFVETVRAALPKITIFFRELEDTGIHTKLNPDQWFNSRVAPKLAWLQKMKVVFVLDNESSGDDAQMRYYADWTVQVLRKLHAVNLRGAVMRFATGNVREWQYVLFKNVFAELLPGDYVAPNEYSNAKGRLPDNGGNIGRYKLIEEAAGKRLPISIGEAGIAVDYDPHKGYTTIGMPDATFVQQMLDEEVWYENRGITRHLYVIGGYSEWNNFQVQEGALEVLEGYYAANPLNFSEENMATRLIDMTVPNAGTRWRETPGTTGKVISTLDAGIYRVERYLEATVPANNYNWMKIRKDNVDGWIAKEVVTIVDVPDNENPDTDTTVELDELTLDNAKQLLLEVLLDLETYRAKIVTALAHLQTAI